MRIEADEVELSDRYNSVFVTCQTDGDIQGHINQGRLDVIDCKITFPEIFQKLKRPD